MTKLVRRAALVAVAPLAVMGLGCPKGPRVIVESPRRGGMVLTSNGEVAVPRRYAGDMPAYVGREGVATVRVAVDENGRVQEATVVEGHSPVFDSAVLEAVRTWRFDPLWADGRPRSWTADFRLRFRDGPERHATRAEVPVPARADLPYLARGSRPKPVERPAPKFPYAAKRRRLDGPVTLEVVVTPDGRVEEARFVAGDPVFARSSLAAAKKWRFEPHPTPWMTRIEFPFTVHYYYRIRGVARWRIKPGGPVPPPPVQYGDAFALRPQDASWEDDERRLERRPPHLHRELPKRIADGADASVSVHLVIGTAGRVTDARITRSDAAYDAVVLDSVAKWQFELLRIDRVPTAWRTTATLHFRAP